MLPLSGECNGASGPAGVYGSAASTFGALDYSSYSDCLEINSIAPIHLSELLTENLRRGSGKKQVFITSKMGSITDNSGGGSLAYRASKAALNAAVKSLAVDLAGDGITSLLLHPGWVQTDMGGSSAPTTAEESVSGMRSVIATADRGMSGQFLDFRGQRIPW